MPNHEAQGLVLISFGVGILWVAWGNVLELSNSASVLCYTAPEGLHLDSSFQLVYRSRDCPTVVYEYALSVFLLLSVVGNGAVMGGLYSVKQSIEQPD